ncbi:MAG: hypothetical protein ACTSUO_06265 [Candidatus Thorarchaeota archaeon]
MSKKGRKGGSGFPRYDLSHLSTKLGLLASKTSQKAAKEPEFCTGILTLTAGPRCRNKIAALRHFGLLEKDELKATDLCIDIASHPDDEKIKYYQKAFFSCEIFKKVYETFSGREVKLTEIITYSIKPLDVHLDNSEEFVNIFTKSILFSSLAKETDDGLLIEKTTEAEIDPRTDKIIESVAPNEIKEGADSDISIKRGHPRTGVVNIDIKIDPTLDPEKLEEHLKKLRDYGLI